jgi:hypothetical protein
MNVARIRIASTLMIAASLVPMGVQADGTREDYARANGLRERYQQAAIGTLDSVGWIAKTSKFWYRHSVQFYTDLYSRVDAAPVLELHRASDQRLVAEIERGDLTTLKAAGWKPPEVFTALGRDGKTDFELLVVPGMGHGSGGEYGQRRNFDFFVQHLQGQTPPAWNSEPTPAATTAAQR